MSRVTQPAALVRLLFVVAASLALSACVGRTSDLPYAPPSFNAPPDSLFRAEIPTIGLARRTWSRITVFRAPELTGEYRVDASGNIVMPLIGQTQVLGMTTTEASAALRENLSRRYYVDPNVTVALREGTSQRVTVDGSVGAPGVYPIPGRTSLMQAVAMARGLTPDANPHRVVIFRQIQGQRMVAAFDLDSIREATMEDPQVYSADIIVVDGSQTRQMMRDLIMTVPILNLFRPVF
jgi:polysaccharide export outer membrane protein